MILNTIAYDDLFYNKKMNKLFVLLFFANITFSEVLLFECAYDKDMNPEGFEDLSDENTVDGKPFTFTYNIDMDARKATVKRNDSGFIDSMEKYGFSKVKTANIKMEIDKVLISYCMFEDNCIDTTDSINRETLELKLGQRRSWSICKMQVGSANRKF